MDHVVVDVEIQKTIDETPGGWNATNKLGVAVACVWEYQTQRMRVYGPDDVAALQKRLLKADRISGYNIWNFDFPVIWGVAKPEWIGASPKDTSSSWPIKNKLQPKTNDILRRIWQALGRDPEKGPGGVKGTRLDDIAPATIGVSKIGNGADAPVWYQAGQVQKVCNYCADDVAIERDLTDFVDRYGYVIHCGQQLFLKEWTGA